MRSLTVVAAIAVTVAWRTRLVLVVSVTLLLVVRRRSGRVVVVVAIIGGRRHDDDRAAIAAVPATMAVPLLGIGAGSDAGQGEDGGSGHEGELLEHVILLNKDQVER